MTINERINKLNARRAECERILQTDITLEKARDIANESVKCALTIRGINAIIANLPEHFSQSVPNVEFKSGEDNFAGKMNILIMGDVGTGKTTTAYLYCVLEKIRYRTQFDLFRYAELFTSNFGAAYSERLESVANIPILIIDDFATREIVSDGMKDAAGARLDELINERYANNRRTIFTTNCSISEVGQRISRQSFDRIFESCRTIEMSGESRRKPKG